MKKLFMSQFAIGVISVLVWGLLGTVPAAQAAGPVNFIATDEPGPWFKCVGNGCVPKSVALTESLAIVPPNTELRITNGGQTSTVHTFTSLLYPTGATNMPFDQPEAFRGSRSVRLVDPGLYVFVCKLHPFMLAATIVDDPATVALPPSRRDRHMTSARTSRLSATAASASPRPATWLPGCCEPFS